MRYLFTLCLAMVCMLASAQTPSYPEYPFQYNPDGNADGFIGLNDLLDLLSLYGQQHPESFYGDSTGAVLFVGPKTPGGCLRASELAGKSWRVLNTLDARRYDIAIAQLSANQWDGTSSRSFNYHVLDRDMDFIHGDIFWTTNPDDWVNNEEGAEEYPDGFHKANRLRMSNTTSMMETTPQLCFLVTEVYPQIDYHIVNGFRSEVQSEVADSLSNGWKLNGGISAYSSANFQQSIWKYAE